MIRRRGRAGDHRVEIAAVVTGKSSELSGGKPADPEVCKRTECFCGKESHLFRAQSKDLA
jgi:hypothetical protein